MVLLLTILCSPSNADIYAYTDGRGVRHISNIPNDSRYRLVKRTPKYKQAAPAKRKTVGSFKTASNTNGWRLITPFGKGNSAEQITLSNTISKKIKRHLHKSRKPFKINEQNRRRFAGHIKRIAGQHRLDPALLHAIISAESAFNPKAVSHAGAQGLMQLMPATARRFGVANSFDPIANVNGGARYLRWLMDRFKNLKLALAAYNAGEGAVEKYGNKIPPYKETQTYVGRVLDFYNHYRTRVN
jgi:soluble lytic murein transglycosylase-like protein